MQGHRYISYARWSSVTLVRIDRVVCSFLFYRDLHYTSPCSIVSFSMFDVDYDDIYFYHCSTALRGPIPPKPDSALSSASLMPLPRFYFLWSLPGPTFTLFVTPKGLSWYDCRALGLLIGCFLVRSSTQTVRRSISERRIAAECPR